MFGRKRKQEQDNLGLSAPIVSPSVSLTPTGSPTPGDSPNTGPAQTPPAVLVSGTATTNPAMLGEILSGNGPIGELIAQIKADPQGFRDRIMQQAQAAGVSTYVLNHQSAGAAQQPQHVDVVEELTRAADLHDKGALTDAEFEALKKKLLAES